MVFERTRALMAEEDIDAIVATSYENVAYLSGAVIMTQRQIPDRLAAVILPLEGEPTMVVCTIEEAQARRDSRIPDIRGYVEFVTSPTQTIAEVVREKGLDRARLGVEMKVLSAHYFQELKDHLPHAIFVPADRTLDVLRAVKSREEIDLLQKAALSTDQAIRSAYECGGPGVSDKALSDALANGIQANGADSVAFLVLGAGPGAALAHPVAANRPLEEGDIVRCDVGGFYSGYYSDLARTAVVGRATPEQERTYDMLWQIHEETIQAARPGVRAKDLFLSCKKAFERWGLSLNLPHIGHSLGLGLHEHPILNPFNETILEEGMVLAIEPVHRVGNGPIFHVEDLVEVTAGGGRVLSRSADWSKLFVMDN